MNAHNFKGKAVNVNQKGKILSPARISAPKFIAIVQAILAAGKRLQQLQIEEVDKNKNTQMRTVRSVLLRKLISTASSSSVISTAANFLSSLNNVAAGRRDLENVFIISDGKFPEVQMKTRTKFQLANEKLDQLIGLYRKQLRMHNLEFLNVSGVTHLIELLLANEELSVVCLTSWDSFLKTFIGHYSEFQAAVQALAALDCLYALAMLSRDKNYVSPVFVSDEEPVQILITSGRHLVMENILQENFVLNDSNLHAEGQNIRRVALIAIMAQVTSSWLASILAVIAPRTYLSQLRF
ncbi:DNA mismatch repair protein MSH3 [Abeliophyllum distichum]|uniref:DNA mismatch repair protein MSH3 n=1 Tax=Abeliophyllum distichum TaxID=126358 RepID=A0ABD1U0N1_9LAMI